MLFTNNAISEMISSISLTVQMVIEGKFTAKFGANSETRVVGVFNHMKTFYHHVSLPVNFNLIKLKPKKTRAKFVITASNRE